MAYDMARYPERDSLFYSIYVCHTGVPPFPFISLIWGGRQQSFTAVVSRQTTPAKNCCR